MQVPQSASGLAVAVALHSVQQQPVSSKLLQASLASISVALTILPTHAPTASPDLLNSSALMHAI